MPEAGTPARIINLGGHTSVVFYADTLQVSQSQVTAVGVSPETFLLLLLLQERQFSFVTVCALLCFSACLRYSMGRKRKALELDYCIVSKSLKTPIGDIGHLLVLPDIVVEVLAVWIWTEQTGLLSQQDLTSDRLSRLHWPTITATSLLYYHWPTALLLSYCSLSQVAPKNC
jgi:hypothetical protein